MAKGGYFCICYPEDLQKNGLTIQQIVDDIHKYGAESFYILHDKDQAKPHFHFCCMWKKDPMPWKNEFTTKRHKFKRLGFLCFMRQHFLLSPQTDKNGRIITKYSYSVAAVRDVDACINYCTHGS